MATHASAFTPDRSRTLRRCAWALAWLALAVLSIDFLVGVHAKYHAVTAEAYAMFWSRRAWLWTHLAGGALTIVLGPLQFLSRWPRPFARLHRASGWMYVSGILIGSIGATGLIATSPAPFAIRSAFAATALAWLGTGLVALMAIRRAQVVVHRRWMTRNYLVTLSPVTFRLLLHGAIAAGIAPSPDMIAALLWASWALPLVAYEMAGRTAGRARMAPTA
ncbi:MAG: DUF2306 domain-containing protein [Xanthomonadales bacterium]|nr:DUF2306 domain-containing protein [Xanthomonadales bacterium]